jgi:hypothetical protein
LSCSVEDLLQHASGRDDALATEVESEINQYRHQAHCIAEMLATLRLRGDRRRTRCRDRFTGSSRSKVLTFRSASDPYVHIPTMRTHPENRSTGRCSGRCCCA